MNRHAGAGHDETTSRSHHSLREQIGQLVDRERVLIGENCELRRQLVEVKEQEKKKYDDLMVQYRELSANANLKRDYDGVDYNGTAANQVTVKTEFDDEDVKQEMKVEIKEEDDQEDHDILIKQEQLDDQSHNGQQQMDNEDPDTNAYNVILDIKTEPMNCDFVVVKEEIKEEEDDCDGRNRWIVKKEEVSDDDEVDNDGHGLPFNEVNDEGGVVRDGDNYEVDDEPNVDNGELLSNPSRDNQSVSNVNDFIEEGGASLEDHEQIAKTANQSNDQTQSYDLLSPSTSPGQDSNRTALNEQATVSTCRKANKRKQAALNRTGKTSKQTIEEEVGDDDDKNIANQEREEEAKVKVLHLNCTQSKCNVKLDSLDHLYDHLRTIHRILPFQCFATNCNARFDNAGQIGEHIKLSHFQGTQFDCAVCHREFDSQHKAYKHWYQNHLTGQFECNFVSNCGEVTDTRNKMRTHQQAKHYFQSKHFHCTQPDCTASFTFKAHLKLHELTHLASNQFHCNWSHCSKQCKQRANLVKHIRTKHFGLPQSVKEQKAKNIVDLRDPNEYVRVVVDE